MLNSFHSSLIHPLIVARLRRFPTQMLTFQVRKTLPELDIWRVLTRESPLSVLLSARLYLPEDKVGFQRESGHPSHVHASAEEINVWHHRQALLLNLLIKCFRAELSGHLMDQQPWEPEITLLRLS